MNSNNWKKRIIQFLGAQTISLFGSSLVQYAIIWYITLSTSSGLMMTMATICGYVPQIVISLFAGVWLDRYNRKKIMMLADGAIAGATLIIALLFIAGHKNIWLLFAVLIVRSVGTGIQTPAVNSLMPQIVPREHLMKVNGINSSIQSLMMFLSPAVSGAILSVMTIETTFFIDVITAAIAIGIMFTIAVPEQEKQEKQEKDSVVSALWDIKSGFAYVLENRFILKQILFLIVIMILISPSAFLTPLMVSRTFGSQVWRLSASEMVFSLGAVTGGILIASWGGFKNRMHTILLATASYGAMMMGMGGAPIFMVYLLFNFLIGISMPCFNAPVNVILQEKVEPSMHGRVFSMMQIASAASLPLGTLIFGPMADFVRIQTILIFNGAAVILCAIYVWCRKKKY